MIRPSFPQSPHGIPQSETDQPTGISDSATGDDSGRVVSCADPEHLPGQDSGAEVPFQQLDPRNVSLQRLLGLIFSAVVLIGGFVGLGIWWLAAGTSPAWWIAVAGWLIVSGLLFWSSLSWPAVEHRHARWGLTPMGLEIHRGVFWQHRLAVPLARLQHADISQGPFQRRFGLAKLVVHTAGTANASVELDGLAHETAVWLRDRLISQREADDVV